MAASPSPSRRPRAGKQAAARRAVRAIPAVPEPVWVFETDVAGAHDGSIAALAARCHGATPGAPGRLVGNSYALPTRDESGALLPPAALTEHVRALRTCAEAEPGKRFRVLPGTRPKPEAAQRAFAELFRNVPDNVLLPGRMLELLDKLTSVRIVVLDANARLMAAARRARVLDEYFACNAGLWSADYIEIVSFGAPHSLVMNDEYARAKGYRHRILSIDKTVYGGKAALAREILSIAYATKLLLLNDPMGTSAGHHIAPLQLATTGGLQVDEMFVEDAAVV